FRRRDAFVLPVYRVIVNDAERTRYYLDPASGALIQRTDANGRWHRWLFGALHRFDFPLLRGRPLWDVIVLLLMLGGTAVAPTGPVPRPAPHGRRLGRGWARARRRTGWGQRRRYVGCAVGTSSPPRPVARRQQSGRARHAIRARMWIPALFQAAAQV